MAYAKAVNRRRMVVKLAGGLLAVVLGAVVGAYAAAGYVGDKIYRSQVVDEARSIADMAENVGAWASTYRGVWVRDDGLTQSGVDIGTHVDTRRYRAEAEVSGESHDLYDTYYRKNPALVQRELADVIRRSNSRGKFRLTSDKYMNPMNAPDGFDTRAMEAMRKSGQEEYFEVQGGEMKYARRVLAKESCMACHDTPAGAPAAISRLYPGPQGYGYVKGGLAGIISVRVPCTFDRAAVFNAF